MTNINKKINCGNGRLSGRHIMKYFTSIRRNIYYKSRKKEL